MNQIKGLYWTHNHSLEFKTIEVTENHLNEALGADYREQKHFAKIGQHNQLREFRMYSSKQTDRTIIVLLNNKEEVSDMNIHDAYLFKYDYGVGLPITDLTDSQEGYLDIEEVEWEASVHKYTYDVDMTCIRTNLTFTDVTDDEVEMTIGKANITVLDQAEEPYDLLEEADIISDDLVFSFNGVPVYADEFELEDKLRRRKSLGVYGKVAIVENFYIQGPINNIDEAEKLALESLIDYFTTVQVVDFIIVNPILCDFHEHTFHTAKTEHEKRLLGAPKIRQFLKEELNFHGTNEPTDSLIYPIVDIEFEVPAVSESEKSDTIYKMAMFLENNKPEQAVELAEKGHRLGIAECTFQLGVFYLTGEHVEKDEEEAFHYFFELAQEGHPDAMHNVALMYFDGVGVDKDASLGYMWMEKAAAKDSDKALAFLEKFKQAQFEMAKNGGIWSQLKNK